MVGRIVINPGIHIVPHSFMGVVFVCLVVAILIHNEDGLQGGKV